MKPSFAALQAGYPTRKDYSMAKLYESIGWSDVVDKPAWQDTCATRMSIALGHAGVNVRGTMLAKMGPLKGKAIIPRQGDLSKMLKGVLGEPDVYKNKVEAVKGIGRRNGIISFFRISGPSSAQGHIDIISPGHRFYECAMACYFDAMGIWFWELR